MTAGLSYEARILHAAADGIAPALLLSAPKGAAQYLINVPEGFARLALEHKLRPSARLSCVLLTSLLPEFAGGLGGLFLRLAQDGHGQVQVIGPRGTAKLGHSFRHIFRWRHPKVLVSECGASGKVPVFEDEYIVLVPVVAGDYSLGCPWCQYGCTAPTEEDSLPGRNMCTTRSSSSSSSSSDTDSTDSGPASQNEASSDGASTSSEYASMLGEKDGRLQRRGDVDKEEHAGSGDSSDSDDTQCRKSKLRTNGWEKYHRKRRKKDIPTTSFPLFSALDDIFSSGNNFAKGMKNVAMYRLKKACGNGSQSSVAPPPLDSTAPDPHPSAPKLDEAVPTTRTRNMDHNDIAAKQETCDQGKGSDPTNEMARATDAPARTPVVEKNSPNLQPAGSYDWVINNATQGALPDTAEDANPLYYRSPCATLEPVANPGVQDQWGSGTKVSHSTVLGFVCFLKKLGTGIVLVDCKSSELLESLWLHPVLRCVEGHARGPSSWYTDKNGQAGNERNRHSVAAVIHLSPFLLQDSADAPRGLERKVDKPPHIVVRKGRHEFGFCSSLETVAKLNVINKKMFPLPFDAVSRDTVVGRVESAQLVNGQEPVWEASMLTRVVFEKGPNGPHTWLDCSECGKAIDTKKIQNELLQSRPQLQAAIREENQSGGRSISMSGCFRTANQLAAASLKERLKQRHKVVTLGNSCTSSEHLDPTLGPTKSHRTMPDSTVPLGTGLRNRLMEDLNSNEDSSQIGHNVPISTPVADLRSALHDNGGSEFELVFLGTGSAEPSKFRGGSGILLQTGGNHSMLLDAGEGSLGQLVRRFGKSRASDVLMSLECVWLSHKHADHVLGILSLLHARQEGAPVLTIIGPSAVKRWIHEVVDVWAAMGYHVPGFQFVHCETLSGGVPEGRGAVDPVEGDLPRKLQRLGLCNLKSVVVDHCHEAYGLVVHAKSGWSVVYSGDTRPCHRLVQAGAGCTLLIHEATFEDDLADHARRKRHSTVPEALDISRRMGAQFVVLTHFSQRYPQVVTLNAARHKNVGLAFDGMVVHSSELKSLGQTLPLLALAFSPSERPDPQPVLPPSYEDAACCIPVAENTRIPKSTGKRVEIKPQMSHLVPKETSIPRPGETAKTRVVKMKGFTSSFVSTAIEMEADVRPAPHKPISLKSVTSQHTRFASSDSESDSSDHNDGPPCQHIRWEGSDTDAG